ncbi:MAG: hypothetical protein U5K72_02945 [Balneolaceae bacterium]|nr:hypothetical protein [Balneolaceae bacterium]
MQLYLLVFATVISAQNSSPLLFETGKQVQTEWTAKQGGDLRSIPIEMNRSVLRSIQTGQTELISVPGIKGNFFDVAIERVIHLSQWRMVGNW